MRSIRSRGGAVYLTYGPLAYMVRMDEMFLIVFFEITRPDLLMGLKPGLALTLTLFRAAGLSFKYLAKH